MNLAYETKSTLLLSVVSVAEVDSRWPWLRLSGLVSYTLPTPVLGLLR